MAIQECLKILGIDENQSRFQQGCDLYMNMERLITEHRDEVQKALEIKDTDYPEHLTQFKRDAILFDAILETLPSYVNEEKGSFLYWPLKNSDCICMHRAANSKEEEKIFFYMNFDINRSHRDETHEAQQRYQDYLQQTPYARKQYYTKKCTLSSKIVTKSEQIMHDVWYAHLNQKTKS